MREKEREQHKKKVATDNCNAFRNYLTKWKIITFIMMNVLKKEENKGDNQLTIMKGFEDIDESYSESFYLNF